MVSLTEKIFNTVKVSWICFWGISAGSSMVDVARTFQVADVEVVAVE